MVGMSESSWVLMETADKMLQVKKGIQQKRKQPKKTKRANNEKKSTFFLSSLFFFRSLTQSDRFLFFELRLLDFQKFRGSMRVVKYRVWKYASGLFKQPRLKAERPLPSFFFFLKL